MARELPPAPTDESPSDTEPEGEAGPDPTDGAPDDAQPDRAAGAAPSGNRFFAWMRSLDVPRQPGWIGGVCAGIAARLGIDPIIVRGVVVVIAVLGGPMFLFYAVAWLLLPDASGRIHLEDVARGRVESPIAAIAAIFVLSFLPIAQGFWFAGAQYWGEPMWWPAIGRTLWTLLLLGVLIAFIVWVARRAHSASGSGSTPDVVPATTDDRPETVPDVRAPSGEDLTAATGAAVAEGPVAAPVPPPVPTSDASAEQLAAWRIAQDEWKAEHREWKARRSASDQEVRARIATENHERALAAAAASAERRRLHRLANPRIPAAAGWLAIGVAVVAGALAGFAASGDPVRDDYATPIAFATIAVVLGLAIVVSGALRRRSGWLSFLAVFVVGATLVAAVIPPDRQLVGVTAHIGVGAGGSYTQVAGRLDIRAHPDTPVTDATDIWQGSGEINIQVLDGAAARIEMISRTGQISVWTYTDSGYDFSVVQRSGADTGTPGVDLGQFSADFGPEEVEPQIIRIFQGFGQIHITDHNRHEPALEEIEP